MLGEQPVRKGNTWSGPVTEVPTELLQHLKMPPLPITIGGASQVTFTLNASVTNPVRLWNGDDYIELRSTVAYTWTDGANTILDSTGATASLTASTLGIWYMYLDEDGANLYPSQTAPSFVEAGYNAGILGHPGTSRAEFLRYVGCHVCTTAATPVFLAAVKKGYTYHFASISVATTATWAALDFSTRVPAIPGVMVAGKLETGVVGTVVVSGSSVEDQGVLTVSAVGLANNIIQAPFGPIETVGDGTVYAKDTVARGDVHITQYVDVV